MKTIDQQIQKLHSTTKTVASYFTGKTFSSFQNDNLAQGEILNNLQRAKDLCYDLSMAIIRQNGWPEPASLEELFELLQEKGVIDSDLVDQLLAMYRLRGMSIKAQLDANDLNMVDEIIRLDLADLELFQQEVKEYLVARSGKKEK